MKNLSPKLWPWFFFTAAFESVIAVVALLRIPSENGLSLARLGLLVFLLLFCFAGCYLGYIARRNASRLDLITRPALIVFSALISLTSSLLLFLLRYLNPEKLMPYYERLSPLLWYLIILGLQSAVFLLLVQKGFQLNEFLKHKSIYISAVIVFCILLFIYHFIRLTKLGIAPDTGYWGEPGVAIQGWQFAISILLGFFLLVYHGSHTTLPTTRNSQLANQLVLPFTIYIAACILWLSVPVEVLTNSFYAPINSLANMPFPYSDAGFYDYLSQSLLIGTKYLGGIPPRPLYVVFLAILHFFLGQNYPAMITAQTLVFAIFPVTLYLLGKKLHSPAAGVTVAMFATFRELVSLWISSNTRVTNSKIFTTDFPTAMGIAVMCLVAIWWLERRDLKSTIVAGGSFGLLLLFRTQSILILPVLFVLAWFAYQRKTRAWIVAGMAFGLVMVLTVLPWLTHNYTMAGKFAFDDPKQVAIIYSQYSFTGNLDLSQFDPAKESVGNRLVTFSLENPAYVAGFMLNHFLNTEIGGLLALPLFERFDGLFEPINLYWVTWNGSLEWNNLLLVILYLAILAVGFGAAWRRLNWIALVPLAFNVGYAAANGVSRFSSWRYNLPVDWVFYFYFAIGAMEVLGGIVLLFGAKADNLFPQINHIEPKSITLQDVRPQLVFIIFAFMFIGAIPWLVKGFAEPRYTTSHDELVTKLTTSGYKIAEIQQFLLQPGTIIMEGRMLYPRMYYRNEGLESMHPWPAYVARDYPRIGFILINDKRHDLIFATKEALDFSQGADVIILACQRDDHLDVRIVDFGSQSFQNAPLSQPCPEIP